MSEPIITPERKRVADWLRRREGGGDVSPVLRAQLVYIVVWFALLGCALASIAISLLERN